MICLIFALIDNILLNHPIVNMTLRVGKTDMLTLQLTLTKTARKSRKDVTPLSLFTQSFGSKLFETSSSKVSLKILPLFDV